MKLADLKTKLSGGKQAKPALAILPLAAAFFATFSAGASILDSGVSKASTDSVIRHVVSGAPMNIVCNLDAVKIHMEGFAPNCAGSSNLRVMAFAGGSRTLFVLDGDRLRYKKVATVSGDGQVEAAGITEPGMLPLLSAAIMSGTVADLAARYFPVSLPGPSWEEEMALADSERERIRAIRQARIDKRRDSGVPAWESTAAKTIRKQLMKHKPEL